MKGYLNLIFKIPGAVKFFIVTEIILGIGLGMWNLSFNLYLVAKGINYIDIGKISSVGPLATAVFAIFCGYICDRIGYKKSMIFGCAIKALAMFITYFAGTSDLLYWARGLNGIGDCFILICEFPYITALVEENQRNTVYSIFFSSTTAALFCGNIFAGMFKEISISYHVILLASCFIMLSVTAFRMFLPAADRNGSKKKKPIFLPRNREMVYYLLFSLVGYATYFLAYSMLNLILQKYLHLPDSDIGAVSGVLLLAASISTFFVPLLTQKINSNKLSLYIFGFISLLYILTAFSGGLLYILLMIITGFMQNMLVALIDGPMLNTIPEENKGGFSGLRFLVCQGGTSLGIFAAGLFMQYTSGYIWIYLLTFIGCLVQIVLFAFGFRKNLENR